METFNLICPFCSLPAVWCENKEVYGKNYGSSYMIWLCRPCDAYVGCHQNTRKPLGTLADANTRLWRRKAHAAFDPLWKGNGKRLRNKQGSRQKKYDWLKRRLHAAAPVHIGESDIETCKKIIAVIEEHNLSSISNAIHRATN